MKKCSNSINLLFCINKKFVPLFLMCVKSIALNGGYQKYNAYVVHSDLDEELQKEINDLVATNVSCQFLRVPDELFNDLPASERYPKQIYYRLAAPILLPKELDKILYLDVDTVIINSLESLYEMDFGGNWFIGCSHVQKLLTMVNGVRLGTSGFVPYINTGVLMMDLNILRDEISMEDVISFTTQYKWNLPYPDQDILNALYGTKVKVVDTMIYNVSDRMLTFYNLRHPSQKRDAGWVRENAVIIHYHGGNRPWHETYNGVLDVFYHENVSTELPTEIMKSRSITT